MLVKSFVFNSLLLIYLYLTSFDSFSSFSGGDVMEMIEDGEIAGLAHCYGDFDFTSLI